MEVQQTRMEGVVALGPNPWAHKYNWSCKVRQGLEGVPKAHCKQEAQHRCQEYQTLGAPLVGEAGKDTQKGTQGDSKARVAQGHSEYRDQVALVPQTLEDQEVAKEVGEDWGPFVHLQEEAAWGAYPAHLGGKAKKWALYEAWA